MEIFPVCEVKLKARGQTTFDPKHYLTIVISKGCHLEKESHLIVFWLELGDVG